MNKELWTDITTVKELDELIIVSEKNIVCIFKHSTRCGVSRTILKQFEKQIIFEVNIKFYYLDLLNYRSISNEISDRFELVHQSPQVIILQNREVIANASHNQILDLNLNEL